jgi:hypothetical protein
MILISFLPRLTHPLSVVHVPYRQPSDLILKIHGETHSDAQKEEPLL